MEPLRGGQLAQPLPPAVADAGAGPSSARPPWTGLCNGCGISRRWPRCLRDEHAGAVRQNLAKRLRSLAEQLVRYGARPLSGGQGGLRGPQTHPVHPVQVLCAVPARRGCASQFSAVQRGDRVRAPGWDPACVSPLFPEAQHADRCWPAANASPSAPSTSPSANGSPRWIPCWPKRPNADLVRNPQFRSHSGDRSVACPAVATTSDDDVAPIFDFPLHRKAARCCGARTPAGVVTSGRHDFCS